MVRWRQPWEGREARARDVPVPRNALDLEVLRDDWTPPQKHNGKGRLRRTETPGDGVCGSGDGGDGGRLKPLPRIGMQGFVHFSLLAKWAGACLPTVNQQMTPHPSSIFFASLRTTTPTSAASRGPPLPPGPAKPGPNPILPTPTAAAV